MIGNVLTQSDGKVIPRIVYSPLIADVDKCEFIQRCDNSSKILIDEDLVDIYLNRPVCTFYYIICENNDAIKLSQYDVSVKLLSFTSLSDLKSYIDFQRVNNYFLVYSINRNSNSYDIRCALIPIEIKLINMDHIRKPRIRDRKINEILE